MPGSVLTIGNFDGVHRGHTALVRRAVELSAGSASVIALAFDPHPLTLLKPDAAPTRLSTFAQRSRWLRDAGADEVIRLEPTAELLNTSPEQFARDLHHRFACRAIVEGSDFRFGKSRAGDVRLLAAFGAQLGFAVHIVDPVSVSLTDQLVARCSSSLVRWLIEHGRVIDASRVLGRPFELEATVIRGDRRGRTIGYPTANLTSPCALPADGVYAGEATLPTGLTIPAAISIGNKPTFDNASRTAEAYLLDLPAPQASGAIPGLPEYGWVMSLRFFAHIRDQSRFATIEALTDQIARDCTRVASIAAQARAPSWIGAEEATLA